MTVINELNGPRLTVTDSVEHPGLVVSLSRPEIVIGHTETAGLLLYDRYASRRHALTTVTHLGFLTIHNPNFTGRTFVSDERLQGPRVLQTEDLVDSWTRGSLRAVRHTARYFGDFVMPWAAALSADAGAGLSGNTSRASLMRTPNS